MLDINLIRNDAEKVKRAIASKNDKIDIDALLELDARRRAILNECEQLRHKRNITSKKISELKSKKEEASDLIKDMKGVSDNIRQLEVEIKKMSEELEYSLIRIPNIPAEDVPVGKDPTSNIEVRSWGEKEVFYV